MNILEFAKRKTAKQKISMITCYDYSNARLVNQSDIDTILVGDSLAMVMHGFDSTVHATVEMMATHAAAVRRGAPDKFVVADVPFLAARKGLTAGMECVATLMQTGSNAVKIEGAQGQLDLMAHIVQSGVPVMGNPPGTVSVYPTTIGDWLGSSSGKRMSVGHSPRVSWPCIRSRVQTGTPEASIRVIKIWGTPAMG